ncbi:unnamed protein product [Calypogeia fissa]
METTVQLYSCDGKQLEVDLQVLQESRLIMDVITATEDCTIFLPVLPDEILKVLEYCKYHAQSKQSINDAPAITEDEMKEWDAAFVQVDYDRTIKGLVNVPSIEIQFSVGSLEGSGIFFYGKFTTMNVYIALSVLALGLIQFHLANYLNIKPLIRLLSQRVIQELAGCQSNEELRMTFGIKNDFTPEQEEEIRNETGWTPCPMN